MSAIAYMCVASRVYNKICTYIQTIDVFNRPGRFLNKIRHTHSSWVFFSDYVKQSELEWNEIKLIGIHSVAYLFLFSLPFFELNKNQKCKPKIRGNSKIIVRFSFTVYNTKEINCHSLDFGSVIVIDWPAQGGIRGDFL